MSSSDDFLAEISEAFGATLNAEPEPKAPKLVTVQIERGLLPEDIRQYLDEHGNLTTTVKAEKKDIRLLRERHHGVARLAAEGVPKSVIATISGYEETYVNTLLQAPSMVQLVEHYRASGNAAAQHIGENLRVVASMSLGKIEERLSSQENKLSTNELIQIAKLGFDRSGHGPQSSMKHEHEHKLIPTEEIERRHKEAKELDRDYIVHPDEIRPVLLPAPRDDQEEAA